MDLANTNRKKIEYLLRLYGSDTLSYFHLQKERQYFFSPTNNSFLSYKIINNVVVIPGDPIGPKEERRLLVESFLQYISAWGFSPCFVGVSDEYVQILREQKMKITKMGEEAILDLQSFTTTKLKKKVRRAVHHVAQLKIDVFFCNSVTMPVPIRKQIEILSQEWVNKKGGKEKGFSMTLKRLPGVEDIDCEFAIAIKEGEVLGYLYFTPCYPSKSLSLDHIRSKRNSPNGLHEFLIIKSAEYFKANHIEKISLNFAAFANMTNSSYTKLEIRKKILMLLMKVYKCDALKFFNNKFQPMWKDRYLAFPSLLQIPWYTWAILQAER